MLLLAALLLLVVLLLAVLLPLLQLCLKLVLPWDSAALAIVVHLAQSVNQVAMDVTVSMAWPASLVTVVPQLHQPQN